MASVLSVVTIAGLVGSITTGFIGMNVIEAAAEPLPVKVGIFAMVLIPVGLIAAYTIAKARRISDFLEALSEERMPARAKWAALAAVWRSSPDRPDDAKNVHPC